jgi:hypothetical protein
MGDPAKALRKGYTQVVSSPGPLDKIKISVEILVSGRILAIFSEIFAIVMQTILKDSSN